MSPWTKLAAGQSSVWQQGFVRVYGWYLDLGSPRATGPSVVHRSTIGNADQTTISKNPELEVADDNDVNDAWWHYCMSTHSITRWRNGGLA